MDKNIIFDLAGVDPQGGQNIYDLIKSVAAAGGAVIVIGRYKELKNDCTTFVEVGYLASQADVITFMKNNCLDRF